MATLSTAAKNAALDAIKTLLETGSVLAAPLMSLANSTGPSLATFLVTFSSPSSGTMTLNMGTITMSAGHLAIYAIFDRGLTAAHISGSIGLTGSGSDIELTAVDCASGQKLVMPTGTIGIG